MARESLTVTSTAFGADERIPKRYAYKGEGDNLSPPITWSGAPEGTRELALICDDPDAPRDEPWVHWVAYKIPASAGSIPEGASRDGRLTAPDGAVQGENTWGERRWGGPLPPKGHGTHHYHFKVYALGTELDLPAGASKAILLEAVEGHVLASGELVGTYSR